MSVNEVHFGSLKAQLWGLFRRPDRTAAGKQPIVVMATGDGLSGSRSSTWTVLGEALEGTGLASFIFDFQGLGNSGGDTKELTLSVGLTNLRDAINVVKSAAWVDEQRIAILGSSFGGNLAILYAAEDSSVSRLALKSPVSSYPETLELMFGDVGMAEWKRLGYNSDYGFNYSMYLDSFKYNTYAAAAKFEGSALVVHGDSDHVVPVRQSVRLEECNPRFSLLQLAGVDHDYAQGNAKDVMATKLVGWLSSELG